MSGVLLVIACLSIGWLLTARGRVSADGANALSRVVVDVALPCLTFRAVRSLGARSAAQLWVPVASAYVAFASAALLLYAIARARRWDRSTTGALLVTATVGNTAFVGLPLIEGLFGRDALPTATLVDQGGSFVIVSTASVVLAASFAGRSARPSSLARKLLTFPPVLGSIAGLVSRGHAIPSWVDGAIERLAALVVPLALLSVGMRLTLSRASLARDAGPLAAGLVVKLAISPAIALVFARAMGLTGRDLAVAVAQCAMAPMVTAAMVAAEHDLRAELASALVAAGVFASLVTVPLWSLALRAGGL